MKTETMEIHTCEFCGKYYKMKHHAKRHVKFCRNNPTNDHACFRDCKNLERGKIECGYNSERVTFTCTHHPLYELYSYAAEKSVYLMGEIENNGCRMLRMPVKCMYYKPESDPKKSTQKIGIGKRLEKDWKKVDDYAFIG